MPELLAKIEAELVLPPSKFPHSFLLKAFLARTGVTEVAALPVSNFYTTTVRKKSVHMRDESGAASAKVAISSLYRGYFYVAIPTNRRLIEKLTRLQGIRTDRITITRISFVNPEALSRKPPHNQTLLVSKPAPPLRGEPQCRSGEVKVCHVVPEGWVCACQPTMWTPPAHRVLTVHGVYGEIANPPYPFPPPPR